MTAQDLQAIKDRLDRGMKKPYFRDDCFVISPDIVGIMQEVPRLIAEIDRLQESVAYYKADSEFIRKDWEKQSIEIDRLNLLLGEAREIGGRFLKAALAGGIRYTDGVGFEFQEFLKKMKAQED